MPARLLNDGRLVRVLAPRPKIRLSRSRDTNAESAAIQMDKFSFSRFSEKRNYKVSLSHSDSYTASIDILSGTLNLCECSRAHKEGVAII